MTSNWWQSFFDDNFGLFLDRENDPDAALAVAFLTEKLKLRTGDRVFDQSRGLDAPNDDNASRGHAEKDYFPLGATP